MQFKTCAIVLAALSLEGALARPSANHRHLHVRDEVVVEERQIGGSWANSANYAGVNFATVNYGGPKATAAPSAAAPTAAVVAAAVKGPSSSAAASSPPESAPASASASVSPSTGSGSGSTSFGGTSAPKNNGNVDQYIGNVGVPYGSNIVKCSNPANFQYTASFVSSSSSPRTIVVWNKSGPDGAPNSGQSSPAAMTFTLAPGSTEVIAFAPNSQGAWCDFTNGKMNSIDGARECAYGEFDFGNLSNNNWSGFDVSKIQATAVGAGCNMAISGAGQTSTCNTNSYDVAEAAIGGIGGNVGPGPLALTVKLGDF